MNKEVKTEWLAALRSGEYEQGYYGLNEGGKFCCLGVLCDLAVKHGVVESQKSGYFRIAYGPPDNTLFLPNEVQEWAGLDGGSPGLGVQVPYGEYEDQHSEWRRWALFSPSGSWSDWCSASRSSLWFLQNRRLQRILDLEYVRGYRLAERVYFLEGEK